MKTILITLVTLLATSASALACGGGEDIRLNDDTILSEYGLFFPITDPENKQPLLIKSVMMKYADCLLKSLKEGAWGFRCHTRQRVFDSKGKMTHKVIMGLQDGEANYTVIDVATGGVRTFKAMLGTRSACGLEEVK